MTQGGALCGPALAIGTVLAIGGLAGWLLGGHPLPAASPGIFAAPVPHRLPRMIVPGACSPEQDEACDPPPDMAEEPMIIDVQWVTCYAGPQSAAAAQPRDAAVAAMAVSSP